MSERLYCEAEGCEKPVKPGGGRYCWMHYKRIERGMPLDAPVREVLQPKERFVQAAIDLADVDSEDDAAYELALKRALSAALATGKLERRSSMAELGRRGGLRGGPARAKLLSKRRRREIARHAATARWKGRER